MGEEDKVKHTPLYEVIVREARARGLAGATVFRGSLSFGAGSRIRTSKVLDLSSDLPVVIEIVDEEAKVEGFLAVLHELFDASGCGGLVTMENVDVIRYLHGKGS